MSSRGLIFGITGQTGAGKSAVCAYLKEAGYHVIDADAVSRQVMGPGSGCAKELAEFFGTDILNADGTLNRKLLGAIAFGDNEKLAALNRITHPYILKEVFSRAQAAFKSGAGVVFFDAPTLFESGAYKNCDYVISVLAQKDKRMRRIMERDSLTPKDAAGRMGAQRHDEFYSSKSDFVIFNNGDIHELYAKATEILRHTGVRGEDKT